MDGKTLQHMHSRAHRAWGQSVARIGMSFSEFEYLTAIAEQAHQLRIDEGAHGQHLQDIVEALGVSKASASAMVGKLEERGLVDRFPCRMDARAHHIVLTAEGQIWLARGQAFYTEIAKEMGAEVGNEMGNKS